MTVSSKEWVIVLTIALLFHVAAGLAWWWQPTVEVKNPGASSMRLALAPSHVPSDDRAETVPLEEDDPVVPEPDPIVEPAQKPVVTTPPQEPTVEPPAPLPDPTPPRAAQNAPAEQAASTPSPTALTSATNLTGQAAATTGVSNTDMEADYLATLTSWLARHKRYPRSARRRNLEGTATLSFTMNASGNVLRYEVVRSSGYDVLDREVVNMLQRAEPLPALPRGLRRTSMDITIPIRFELAR
ncbi:energy transducer TonB [Parvibaculaceae bacterium PLY_AMNH_Bact1]|nr:energy transducer TonB [Parvibaculaceae bacterium PLY_AMNH_Bact1]